MSVSFARDHSIDYAPCRYNGSRLWFRGPSRGLGDPYVACLGGCEVYGRYVSSPFPALLDAQIAPSVVNLGVENSGLDAYLNDPGTLCTAANAQVAVIQISGSHNTSNRFYSVHPRRNDRFLKGSSALHALYPEMDFTEVHFTRHLLAMLRKISADRFEEIAYEARAAWQARMRQLINHMNGKVILCWFAPNPLIGCQDAGDAGDLFLDRPTVQALVSSISDFVEIVPTQWEWERSEIENSDFDVARLGQLPGPVAHRDAAKTLAKSIEALL